MVSGSVEVERFRSDGTIEGETALAELRRLLAAGAA